MELISMSHKELDRFDIISRCLRKEIKHGDATRLLGCSSRQVRRMKAYVRAEGAAGLIHGNRDKPSNRRIPHQEQERIKRLLHRHYSDFGPSFASEKLLENHRIDRDPKTIRTIMIREGLWKPRRGTKPPEHREWRPRKEYYGEMQQFDGSYHDWFEGRGPSSCLVASIDDATGKVTGAKFVPHEGVFPVFGFWRDYLIDQGKPRIIYLDKFSTYKMNSALLRDNHELLTQFERAMKELGMVVIPANSPQAKGRIERLFETLQDRLIKEMRLHEISTVEEANRFLREAFIPDFNRRFSVIAAKNGDLHRSLTKTEEANLDAIFSRQETRTIQNDFTLSFRNQWYQLIEDQPVTVRPRENVTVEERLDGSIHLRLRGKYLNYRLLPVRIKRTTRLSWVLPKTALGVKLQGVQTPS